MNTLAVRILVCSGVRRHSVYTFGKEVGLGERYLLVDLDGAHFDAWELSYGQAPVTL
jgi:hypothetical protein